MFADPAPLKSNPMTDGVAAAADTLPLLLREVVQLRFYSDMDVTEICEHLGVTNVVVRKRLSRAMAALKNSFAVGHKLAS
jgi:DNA-directed RNA polymerase specialized sigma24 family protein